MQIINTKKLKISSPSLENLGCYALSSKIYMQKDGDLNPIIENYSLMINDDKLGFYVKTCSMVIDSIPMFTRPHTKFLEELKLNRELKVYYPFSITSLLKELIIVTLKDGDKWYELVGEKVEVITTNYISIIADIIKKSTKILPNFLSFLPYLIKA